MNDKFWVLYLILAIFIALFLLSVYKIYMWAKDVEASKKFFDLIKQQKEKKEQLEFAHSVFKFRYYITCGLFTILTLVLFQLLFFPYAIHKNLIGSLLFCTIILAILANNFIVHKYWRCPFCHERLPIRIGRSGARPKIVHSCPYCQKDFSQEKSGTRPDYL